MEILPFQIRYMKVMSFSISNLSSFPIILWLASDILCLDRSSLFLLYLGFHCESYILLSIKSKSKTPDVKLPPLPPQWACLCPCLNGWVGADVGVPEGEEVQRTTAVLRQVRGSPTTTRRCPQHTNQCLVHSTFFTVLLEYICLYFAQF